MGKLKSNAPCWCGSGRKHKRCHGDRSALARPRVELGEVRPMRLVPDHIERPDYVASGVVGTSPKPQVVTGDDVDRLRTVGAVAAQVLLDASAALEVGVTTDAIDEIAHDSYVRQGAYPSTLGYNRFTKSICTSVNGVICHGIPDSRPLEDGDVINIDVTAFLDGFHGDTSATFVVGTSSAPVEALIETTRQATLRGIAAVEPGKTLTIIGDVIEPYVLAFGYDVVREYGGHGIGRTFHADPHVNHHVVRAPEFIFGPGMTFTIEPMLLTGARPFTQAPDGWTEHADDSMPSAQFEHTVMVTEDGVEIMTVNSVGQSAAGTLSDIGPVPVG